jgi:hypothetical protein
MFWFILFITYVIGMPTCAFIFGENDVEPTVLTIFIAATPFVNFAFVIVKLIGAIIKYFNSDKFNKDVEHLKKVLFD